MSRFHIFLLAGLCLGLLLPTAVVQADVDRSVYLPVAGDLVKLVNDHDPTTTADEAVYYIDQDLDRRAFPNRQTFETWFPDFSTVKEIDAQSMSQLRLVGNILYRPGTRLLKIQSVPKVYAVEPGGVLRWIETEEVATELYGSDWAKMVDDLPDSLFLDYAEGVSLSAPVWPVGTVVRRSSDNQTFLIDGARKRPLELSDGAVLGIQERYVVRTSSDLSGFPEGSSALYYADKLTDAGQTTRLETSSPAVLTVVSAEDPSLVSGEEGALAALRLVSGQPMVLRGVRVNVSGVRLGNGGEALLSNFRLTDASGTDLFGIRPLEGSGSSEEVTFSGALTIPANSDQTIYLRADLSENAPSGLEIDVTWLRSGLIMADGGNGQTTDLFWPREDLVSDARSVR